MFIFRISHGYLEFRSKTTKLPRKVIHDLIVIFKDVCNTFFVSNFNKKSQYLLSYSQNGIV